MAIDQLETFMAAIRRLESNSYDGNYSAQGEPITNPDSMYYRQRAYGAYQIMPGNWPSWSQNAGIGGAPITSKAAQDRVARFVMEALYNEFHDWQLVAVAWFAGRDAARMAQREGASTLAEVKDVTGYSAESYYHQIPEYMTEASARGYGPNLPRIDEVAGMLDPQAQASIEGERLGTHTYGVTTPGISGTYPTPDSSGFRGFYPTVPPSDQLQGFLSQPPAGGDQVATASPLYMNLVSLMDSLSNAVAGGSRSAIDLSPTPFDQQLEARPEGVSQEQET